MRFIAVLSALLALSGCASIPFSTMAIFSQFDEKTLTTIDPNQMLVKVSVDDDFTLKPDSTKLQLSVKPKNANRSTEAAFGLELLSKVTEKRATGLFSAEMEVTTYEFKVDQTGVAALKQLQTQFETTGISGDMSFSVETNFDVKDGTEIKDEMSLWIDLQLSEQQGYIPLFDAAKMEVKKV
ncbi:hypothetical protein Rhein_3952 [Rheinheimera sp. A13L]|uniref:hypothetical protein n=1 Tax=Rheinheimera sp. A13L TaxID=506534 RepID=UPI0002124F2C|nr:hypothetical protein [Rheinheimera sp. A13L]EGM75960.1 hypothetical protein Rhein_3952 [Rheinheimera sp. A13L]